MTELKVHCDCGQKFKFDVQPVNNQMPFTVACPICKRDGTGKANAMLQQMAIFHPVDLPPPQATPPPLPIAPPPPPHAPATPGRLRVSVAVPAAAMAATPPPAPALGTPPPPIGAWPRPGLAASAAVAPPGEQPSFGRGILGAFLGALVGAILYYIIFKTTGHRFFLSLGAGFLAGFGANWLGRGEGSKELGGLAVVFMLSGVLAAQYLVELQLWKATVAEITDAGYSEMVIQAKEVVKAVPTGSNEEIKMYLAKENAGEGEVVKPSEVTDKEITEFKEKELPRFQDLASGKVTKEQYQTQSGLNPEKMKALQGEEGENTFKSFFILWTINLRSIFSMVIGASVAFKLSTNARGE